VIEVDALANDDLEENPLVVVVRAVGAIKGEMSASTRAKIIGVKRAGEALRPEPLRQQRRIGVGCEDFVPRVWEET